MAGLVLSSVGTGAPRDDEKPPTTAAPPPDDLGFEEDEPQSGKKAPCKKLGRKAKLEARTSPQARAARHGTKLKLSHELATKFAATEVTAENLQVLCTQAGPRPKHQLVDGCGPAGQEGQVIPRWQPRVHHSMPLDLQGEVCGGGGHRRSSGVGQEEVQDSRDAAVG